MKKYLLLLMSLIQTTFLLGQEWSSWTTIPNSSISFSAKYSGFNDQSNMHAWNIKFKANRLPVYFEYKIKSGYVSGSNEIDKFFNTTIFDNKDNENRINGSGGLIYSASKTLSVAIRNVCFDFGQDKYPKCQKSSDPETLTSSNSNSYGNTQAKQQQQQGYDNGINTAQQISGVIVSVTPAIVSSAAAARKFKIEERNLFQKLRGNESQYPDAAKYFNEFLKQKRKTKTIAWVGGGLVITGAIIAVVGEAVPALAPKGDADFSPTFYAGCGVMGAGCVVALFSIPHSAKAAEAFEQAKSYVSIGISKKGLGIALNF